MDRQRRAVVVIVDALHASGGNSVAASGESSGCSGALIQCGNRAVGVAKGDGFELGLYVPGADGGARDVSGGASSCPGCRWEVVPACEGNVPGTGSNDLNCSQAAIACADTGGTLVDVYLKRPGDPWRTVSSYCSNPAQPVATPADIAAQAARTLRDMPLPRPGIASQPPGGTAVNLPTVFYADASAPVTVDVTLLGFRASLTATPTSWRWDFGDGTVLTTAEPGKPYPSHTITHAYRRRGTVTATVTTTWTGVVVVPAIGELPVAETVSRSSARQVMIREARAELVTAER